MKKIVIAVGAILVLLLVLPLLTGMMTRSRVEARVAELDSNPFASIEVVSYDLGWFASTARIDLGIDPSYIAQISGGAPPGADMLAQRLPFLVEFKHGPVIFGDGVQLALSTVVATFDPASPVATLARDLLGMPYVFELRGRGNLWGGFEYDADVPAIDYGDGTNDLAFSGLRVDGTMRGDNVTMRGNADSFDYTSPFATAVVEQMRFTMDMDYTQARMGIGSGEFVIEHIAVMSPMAGPEPMFTAQGLRMGGHSAIDDNGRVRVGANYGAASVATGTSFSLADAELGIAVTDLDAEAMNAYYETVELVMGQQPAASPDELIAALVPVFERLLEGGPNLALDPIRFVMNGEPFSAKVLVEVDPAALPPAAMRNYQDPMLWITAATVTADAEVSKILAQDLARQAMRMQLAGSGDPAASEDEVNAQADAQADFILVQLAGTGMLQDTGNAYTTSARFASGTLTVNGTQVPLGF